ncbi:MAG: sensor histidine kinase [Jatrophihabitans sp.]|uniref:sensor histidine kinase n=1 Tax=Jatrophihabitans sp. TaxID=1932789 RepID=UPI003F7FA174
MIRRLVRLLGSPAHWWTRQSLRAKLTVIATALFSFAVGSGAVLVIALQRYALVRVLDSSSARTAHDIAQEFRNGKRPQVVDPTTSGIAFVQVVDADDALIASSFGADPTVSIVTPDELAQVRAGTRLDVTNPANPNGRLRVYGRRIGPNTVLVMTDLSRVDDSIRVLKEAALVGGPVAVALMAVATYATVSISMRSVAALRHGAADITAAGLAEQRLPVPPTRDEMHNLAETLNAMLDRIDSATQRQRTFVGDAAHELRSPLASLRVQLEVGARLGQDAEWPAIIDDALVDVDRLDRLVGDLLALARLDEAHGALLRKEDVDLADLVDAVVAGHLHARVAVTVTDRSDTTVEGDPDGLRRVIINLVDNAVRYASTSVEVTVGSADDVAVVTVTDDGPGIPEAERRAVFDRFYRTHASRSRDTGGTGLGLAIVRDVVTAHHGSVWLDARPDGARGLHATVTLPLHQPD